MVKFKVFLENMDGATRVIDIDTPTMDKARDWVADWVKDNTEAFGYQGWAFRIEPINP